MAASRGNCPICGHIITAEEAAAGLRHAPFCSKRCADVDLNRWLSGGYAIPVVEHEPDDIEALSALPPPNARH